MPFTAQQFVSWEPVGMSSGIIADRFIGLQLKEVGGWRGYIASRIESQYLWGARRFGLWLPFGQRQGEPMQFDQFLHAKAEGLTWATNYFGSAWASWFKRHPGTEGICYFGSLVMDGVDDPDFA